MSSDIGVLVRGKLVAVVSAGWKIGSVIMMVSSAMAIGPLLGKKYRLISCSCHLIVNIIMLTPDPVAPTTRDKHRPSQLKTSRSSFLDQPS
jgi:hypothetical protein